MAKPPNKFEGGSLGEGQGEGRFGSSSGVQAEEALVGTADAYGLDIEALRSEFRPFLADRLRTIYNQAIITPEFISGEIRLEEPEQAQYASEDGALIQTPFGTITLNPNTQNIDWDRVPNSAFTAFDFGDDAAGRTAGAVFQEFVSSPLFRAPHNLDAYELPGIEFWKWLKERGIPERKVPSILAPIPFVLAGSRIGSSSGWEVAYIERRQPAGQDDVWSEHLINLGNTWNGRVLIAMVRKSALDEARLG